MEEVEKSLKAQNVKYQSEELKKASYFFAMALFVLYSALSVVGDLWIVSVCKSWVAEGKRLMREYPQEP